MASGDFTRINTNIAALNALNSLKAVQSKLGTAQLRLATGKQINSAADDPAGLTIATKFEYRASGLGAALNNIGDAKNMMSVAEGGLSKINDILVQMRDKATQAASDTMGSEERTAIKSQLDQFAQEINAIVNTTKWNGKLLLDGINSGGATGFTGTINFQVGADVTSDDEITLTSSNFGKVDTTGLTLAVATNLSVDTYANATVTVGNITAAIGVVSARLQTVGALVSRLSFREETVTVAKVNTEAARSRIMDADMASEQLNATKYQILQQTATAMLSSANQGPQNLLTLFR
jgi:flagellin